MKRKHYLFLHQSFQCYHNDNMYNGYYGRLQRDVFFFYKSRKFRETYTYTDRTSSPRRAGYFTPFRLERFQCGRFIFTVRIPGVRRCMIGDDQWFINGYRHTDTSLRQSMYYVIHSVTDIHVWGFSQCERIKTIDVNFS